MAVFPSDSIRTKNWGDETLTDSDLETQFDLLHSYFQACLNATSGHAHTGASNQGPKISPANLLIASQATGDLLYASSATAWARLAKGTALYYLRMNSGGTLPEWAALDFASSAEVKTGTEAAKVVAPNTIIGHEGVCKGWINFNGSGTIAINDSYNVSGIVDSGTGNYTVTWDTDFASANYAVSGMAYLATSNPGVLVSYNSVNSSPATAGATPITTWISAGAVCDPTMISLIAIGDR